MDEIKPLVGMIGAGTFFLGFALAVRLAQRHGGRRQHYILQAYLLGMLAGAALCLIVLFLVFPEGMS